MNFGDKLVKQRKKLGISQAELADMMGVTRQSISKWELSASVPEIAKLIQLSELFGVSIDYLVKDTIEEEEYLQTNEDNDEHEQILKEIKDLGKKMESNKPRGYHYTSKRRIGKIPLVDIRFSSNLSGMSEENTAKGIIAIGNVAIGVISIGGTSFGIIALGGVSIGLLSIAITAIGLLSLGVVSIGAIAIGFVAVGYYAAGFCVAAKELGIGNIVAAHMAIGKEVDGQYTLVTTKDVRLEDIIMFIKSEYTFIPEWLIKIFIR